MPDDSWTIEIKADVSDLTSNLAAAGQQAEATAEEINAAFEKSGSVIKDFADNVGNGMQMSAESMQEWRDATGLASESAYGIVTSTEAVTDAMLAVGDSAETSGKQMKESAEESGSSMEGMIGSFKSAIGEFFLFQYAAQMVMGAVKDTIASIMELGDSIRNTSAMLNVGANEARGFNEAMSSLGVNTTSATQAIRHLETDAASGGKSLARLGISAQETDGTMKSGLQLFEETVDRINNLSDANQRAEAAYTLLGRGASSLLGVLGDVNSRVRDGIADQENNTEANKKAEEQSLLLHEALTKLKSAWDDAVVNISPIVVAALSAISSGFATLKSDIKAAADECNYFADQIAKAVSAAAQWVDAQVKMSGDPAAGEHGLYDAPLASGAMEFKWQKTHPDGYFTHMGEEGVDVPPDQHGEFKPKAKGGGGGGGKGGGGGAGEMDSLNDALIESDLKMQKLNAEFAKMGTEAEMAGKISTASFADLKAQATADFNDMTQKHAIFVQDVQSGDKLAADAAKKDWDDATKVFEDDWKKAAEKAKQDMQDVKQVTGQVSSEISGLLNQALSGKLNWATELQKVLTQMLDEVVKYSATMVAQMVTGSTLQQAAQTAGQGNMLGSLINWLAGMTAQEASQKSLSLAMETAHATAKTAVQTAQGATDLGILGTQGAAQVAVGKSTAVAQGTTDAGLAAANTIAALTPIPYIGPALAAATAPTIFAETLGYAAAESGFDVPPGSNPMTQLHSREMVLPQAHADVIRSMAKTGGASGAPGGGSQSLNQTFNIQSLDPSSLGDIVNRNPDMFAGAAAKALRGGFQAYTG